MKTLHLLRTIIFAGSLLLQLSMLCFPACGAAGGVDLSFDAGSGVNRHVDAIAVQPDGKAIISGVFTTVNGFARPGLARLHSDGTNDATFAPATGFNNVFIAAIAVQNDGKILVCGQFRGYAASAYAARLHSDGTLDNSFIADGGNYPSYPYGEGRAYTSVVVQSDGKVVLGGYFTDYFIDGDGGDNYPTRSLISRLNTDGTLDPSFDFAPGEYYTRLQSIVLQQDGKVFIGGEVGAGFGVSRLNANGSPDSTFNGSADISGMVYSIALQLDGKVLLGGLFGNATGTGLGIARLHSDGSRDDGFNPGTGANGVVYSVAAQADGKVLLAGRFTTVNGTSRNSIARLNANGSLDSGFNPGSGVNGYSFVSSAALQADGKVLIGGTFSAIDGTNRERIARLNPNGGLDNGFHAGTSLNGPVTSLAVQMDGKLLLGGRFTMVRGANRNGIARLNPAGSLDSGFNPGAGAEFDPVWNGGDVHSVIGLPDGAVLMGGTFDTVDGTTRSGIARLNANGSLDTGFTPDTEANNKVVAGVLQADGKVVIGGHFTTANGAFSTNIIRLNPDGSRDSGFNPDREVAFLFDVKSLVLQPDAKVLVGGVAYTFIADPEGGDYWGSYYLLIRLHPDGSRDTSFEPAVGAVVETGQPGRASVNVVSVQPDGKVLFGGEFLTVKGANRNRIARLNANGTLDPDFNPLLGISGSLNVDNPTLKSIAVQPNGKVLIAGEFTRVNEINRNRMARLNADGSVDRSFDPGTGADGVVRSMALQPDGNVLIAGDFTTVNGVVRPRVARLYGNSQQPPSFAAWAAGFGLSGADASASADPDHDGLPNATEFVLGGDPASSFASVSGRPAAIISGGNMLFTFPRNDESEIPDITLTVESGTDLVTWPTVFTIGPNTAASSPGVSISENATAPDTITVTIPQGTALSLFARLKVTIAP